MKTKLLLLGALLALQCATTQAQIPITANLVAPVTGVDDQYYLPGAVVKGTAPTNAMTDGALTYVAGDQRSKGQSFTTGPNPSGYAISAITVRHLLATSGDSWANVPNGASFLFRFGTISGSTLTPTLTTTATYSGTAIYQMPGRGTGNYLTLDLSGAGIGTLSPNTTYFFELASAANPPFFELHNTRTNASSYTGGTAFRGNGVVAVLDEDGVVALSDGDFAFHAKLTAVGAPTVVATVDPASGLRGESFTITATVTPGGGAVTDVSVNLGAIGGSASASLVLSNANVYTNTFTVPSGALVGTTNLTVTAKDTTPLTGNTDVSFTVLAGSPVWNGASLAGNTWSDSANWLGNIAPLTGDNLTFAGTTRLTPDMDANYSVSSLVFSNTADAFTINSSTASTLTIGTGGIVNNSANAQTLNVPVTLSTAQTLNAASGSLILNSNITGGVGLTVTGGGGLTFASPGTNALGNLQLTNGLLNIIAGTVNVNETSGFSTWIGGDSTLTVSGGTLNIRGANSWWPIGVTAGATGTVVVAGGTINVANSWGSEVGNADGTGVLTINSGAYINNDTGGIGFIISDGSSAGGTVNLDGGALIVNKISAGTGAGGEFFFNGGTLKPTASNGSFWNSSGTVTASIRNGGAVVDTAGFNITIGQTLAHSTVAGDNATDGGLTKTGNGTLILAGGYYFTGPTKVLSGTLSLNPSLGVPGTGGDLLVSNATLVLDASSGAIMPAADMTLKNGAVLNVTNYPYGNAISGSGNLALSGGTAINLNYGTLYGTPAAAIYMAGSLSASGTNVINITGSGFVIGQFPLIDYTGTAVPTNSFRLASLPPGVTAVLVNNADNTSLDLLVSVVGNALSWHGASADNSTPLTTWDINTSANWYDAGNNAVPYVQYGGNTYGDLVTFGDNGYDFDADGTNSVNLPGRVVPSAVAAANNSYPYTLTGTGGIDGSTAFVKDGANWFLLGTSNNFTGGTFVNAGTLAITNDSALGAASGVLTLGGGTLQIAGDMADARLTTLTTNSTVDALAGVTGRLQLNGSITAGSGLTKTGNGTLMMSGTTGTNAAGNLLVSQGLLKLTNGTFTVRSTDGNSKIDVGGAVEIATGATLTVTNGGNSWFPVCDTAGTTNTLTLSGGVLNINNSWGIEIPRQGNAIATINSGTMVVNDIGGSHIGLILGDQAAAESGVLNLNGGALVVDKISANNGTNKFYFNGGTLKPVIAGTFFPSSAALSTEVRNGGAVVDTAGLNVTIAEPLDHSQVPGDSAIDGGLTKTGDGTLNLNGANTYTGPTVVNAGTLGGTGTIAGPLTNNATLAPGSDGIGTLAVNGNITLSAGSTNTFEVNGTTPANDAVVAGAGVTYGGVLNIVADGTFSAGQQFQLFSGTGATNTGSFASIAGTPGGGLAFSFTNGTLSVVATMAGNPTNITFSVSGSQLSLSWPEDHRGWILQTQTNSLNSGLSTNWVDVTGSETIIGTNITINPALPTAFYRLRHPSN